MSSFIVIPPLLTLIFDAVPSSWFHCSGSPVPSDVIVEPSGRIATWVEDQMEMEVNVMNAENIDDIVMMW